VTHPPECTTLEDVFTFGPFADLLPIDDRASAYVAALPKNIEMFLKNF